MISLRAIKIRLEEFLAKNGWEISQRHFADGLSVLVEYWVVDSIWSPADTRIFIGFESYEETHDVLCLSLEEPKFRFRNEWSCDAYLTKGWEEKYDAFLDAITTVRSSKTDNQAVDG